MAERRVKCVTLQRELPGLDRPLFNDALGQTIFENVSKEGWRMFKEHFKMVMNEYRLALGPYEANQIVEKQVEGYFLARLNSSTRLYPSKAELTNSEAYSLNAGGTSFFGDLTQCEANTGRCGC